MMDAMTILAVSMTALFATSIDNLAILVALYARFRGRALLVTMAHLGTTTFVVIAAWFLGEAAARAPVEYVGLLGVVPLTIGVYWLYGLLFRRGGPASVVEAHNKGRVVVAATVMSLIGNSVDTLLTMTVMFADSRQDLDILVLVGALVAATLLAMLARVAVSNPALGPFVERHSQRFAPFVMIGIGVYVLANTATDILPGG